MLQPVHSKNELKHLAPKLRAINGQIFKLVCAVMDDGKNYEIVHDVIFRDGLYERFKCLVDKCGSYAIKFRYTDDTVPYDDKVFALSRATKDFCNLISLYG